MEKFEENNQFSFTHPTHIVMALYEAVLELEELGDLLDIKYAIDIK
jgi:aspartate aminotransferase-like enzyme